LQGVRLAPILVFLFAAGFLVGPPMDGFHTNVDLLQYDKLPITIGAPAHIAAVGIQFPSSHRCHGRPIFLHSPPVCSVSVGSAIVDEPHPGSRGLHDDFAALTLANCTQALGRRPWQIHFCWAHITPSRARSFWL